MVTSSAAGSCRRRTSRARSFYGEVVRVGTTSIAVEVEVYAQRRPEDVEVYKVTEALITYVAVARSGEKREIPGRDRA